MTKRGVNQQLGAVLSKIKTARQSWARGSNSASLPQEHMNDISTLQRNQATADLALHQQLQEKDYELRAIRGNMGHWKEETARKLSHKFKEELER